MYVCMCKDQIETTTQVSVLFSGTTLDVLERDSMKTYSKARRRWAFEGELVGGHQTRQDLNRTQGYRTKVQGLGCVVAVRESSPCNTTITLKEATFYRYPGPG